VTVSGVVTAATTATASGQGEYASVSIADPPAPVMPAASPAVSVTPPTPASATERLCILPNFSAAADVPEDADHVKKYGDFNGCTRGGYVWLGVDDKYAYFLGTKEHAGVISHAPLDHEGNKLKNTISSNLNHNSKKPGREPPRLHKAHHPAKQAAAPAAPVVPAALTPPEVPVASAPAVGMPVQPSQPPPASPNTRLLKFKRAFDEGILPEAIYNETVAKIVDEM